MKQKKIAIKYFNTEMKLLINNLKKITEYNNNVKYLYNNENKIRVELSKLNDDKFFITINKITNTNIPIVYNEEDIYNINIADNEHLGELYYAIIDKDVIVATSLIGRSLKKCLEEALYMLANHEKPIEPELNMTIYQYHKDICNIKSVDFTLSFSYKNELDTFLDTPIGNNFSHWFDYNNQTLSMKISCNKNNVIDRDIYNLIDYIIKQSYCKKLKVKFLDIEDKNIEINLLTPKLEYIQYIDYPENITDIDILSILNIALEIRNLGDIYNV